MKLIVEMPWEKDLSINESHFGPGGHYRRKPHVQAWARSLAWQVKTTRTNGGLLEGVPLQIVVDFRYPDKRVRDCENWLKLIADSVAEGLGLVRGRRVLDEHIRITCGQIKIDKKHPGFTITVSDEE